MGEEAFYLKRRLINKKSSIQTHIIIWEVSFNHLVQRASRSISDRKVIKIAAFCISSATSFTDLGYVLDEVLRCASVGGDLLGKAVTLSNQGLVDVGEDSDVVEDLRDGHLVNHVVVRLLVVEVFF